MKKLFLSIIALSCFTLAIAQDDPTKTLKNAKKALSSYMLDPTGNKAKLDEAKTQIDLAVKSDVNNNYEGWLAYGNIYNEFAGKDEAAKMINKAAKSEYPDAPKEAITGFMKANTLAAKKFQKTDAVNGIKANLNRLINSGVERYEAKEYAVAYSVFNNVVAANTILKDAGEKGTLDDSQINNFNFYGALCAQSANMSSEAEAAFKGLIGKGFADEAAVYSGLYNVLNAQGKKEEAEKFLDEGVAKFPNATDLLFNQINSYLRAGKLNDLIDKLKVAISKEPGNVGLYSTLGNVYDNLAQMEQKNKNVDKSKEYFNLAMGTYSEVLNKDPKNFDANYSLGALYYNKAAGYTEELNKLNDDYTDAGIKKYEALKEDMNGIFKQALPFFQKAEAANANDKNTLIALKEILTRLNMVSESTSVKERIDVLDSGKKNSSSFFKN